jgi:hypothetical protein
MTARLNRRDFRKCHAPRPPLAGASQITLRADCSAEGISSGSTAEIGYYRPIQRKSQCLRG